MSEKPTGKHDESTLLRWEVADYVFQHDYNRVEQAAKRLRDKPGSFKLQLSFKEGEGAQSKLEIPDATASMEFALAMSRFIREGSPRRAEAWIDLLDEFAEGDHSKFWNDARQALDRAKQGYFLLNVNGRQLRNAEVYNELAMNVVFADDVAAREYLTNLQRDPILGNLLWMTYYNHCLDVWRILQCVKGYRKDKGIYPPAVKRENKCIYCKGTSGPFTKFEHIIPESLGNETSLLPAGFVCDDCNASIGSGVESPMVDGLPFKLLRPLLLWENKKAKLPSARFSNVHIERESPNRVNVYSQTRKSVIREERLPDGTIKLSFDVKEKIDIHILARGLMKIGLGVIALENGRESALDAKYDRAREYILKGGTFPNNLLVAKQSLPQPGGFVQWQHTEAGGTGLFVRLLGASFAVALTEEPTVEARGPLAGHFTFDLREKEPSAK